MSQENQEYKIKYLELLVEKQQGDFLIEKQKAEIQQLKNELEKLKPKKEIIPIQPPRGDKYQLYDPDTLKLIETYQSMDDLLKRFPDATPQSVRDSAQKNTTYKNYRFKILKRTDEEKEYQIEPTVGRKSPNYEPIAMLSKEKNNIIKVFVDSKEASEYLKEKANMEDPKPKSIMNAVDKNLCTYGHYWISKSKCPKDMLNIYEIQFGKTPDKRSKSTAKKIYKFDENKALVKEYKSTDETVRTEKTSIGKLREVINGKLLFNGFYYSYENVLK